MADQVGHDVVVSFPTCPGISFHPMEVKPAVEGAAAAVEVAGDGREGVAGLEPEEDIVPVPVKGPHGGRDPFRPTKDYALGLFAGQCFAGAGGDKLALNLGRQAERKSQHFGLDVLP